MAKGPATGYIWALKDPRLPEGGNIVYVGNGSRPWESIQRHLKRSSNPRVAKWAEELHKSFPEGLVIRGREVCDRYHGENIPLIEPKDGRTIIEWTILGIEEETYDYENDMTSVMYVGTLKNQIISDLKAQGHPLMNETAGRPRKGFIRG